MKRKLLSILALLMTAATGAWADTTVTITGDNLSDNENEPSFTIEGVTVTNTSGDAIIVNDLEGILTFSTELGNFTEIVINADEIIESDWGGSTWTGNASSVSLEGWIYGISSIVFTISPTVVASGNCGTSGHVEEVQWSLTSDGVLTISGSGDMKDYNSTSMPWRNYRSASATYTIKSIVIEDGVTAIGDYAFQGCSSATSVSIPDGLTTIGSNAFYSCKMESVYIPDDVTTIGSYAFQKCKNLETVTIPGSVTTFGNSVFKECTGLTSVDFLDGVTYIGSSNFYGCTGLKSVDIPASVTRISSSAFYGCTSLESVDIPANVTKIESNVFDGCSSLTSINLYKLYIETNRLVLSSTNAFDNCHDDLKIHVFSDYVDAYKTAPTWINIEDKITPISVTANPDGTGFYWATYYNDLANAKIPDDDTYTQVFKVALSGSTLTLTEISDRVINKGEGVVLKSNSSSIELASAASTGTEAVGGYDDNDLKGTMNSITNPGNAYVLNKTATNGVGFYRLSSEGTIGAHKAYLTYSGDLAREFFLFDEATGIEAIDNGQLTIDNVVYDLQGRRVAQPAKGLYIVNGKKYIKK